MNIRPGSVRFLLILLFRCFKLDIPKLGSHEAPKEGSQHPLVGEKDQKPENPKDEGHEPENEKTLPEQPEEEDPKKGHTKGPHKKQGAAVLLDDAELERQAGAVGYYADGTRIGEEPEPPKETENPQIVEAQLKWIEKHQDERKKAENENMDDDEKKTKQKMTKEIVKTYKGHPIIYSVGGGAWYYDDKKRLQRAPESYDIKKIDTTDEKGRHWHWKGYWTRVITFDPKSKYYEGKSNNSAFKRRVYEQKVTAPKYVIDTMRGGEVKNFQKVAPPRRMATGKELTIIDLGYKNPTDFTSGEKSRLEESRFNNNAATYNFTTNIYNYGNEANQTHDQAPVDEKTATDEEKETTEETALTEEPVTPEEPAVTKEEETAIEEPALKEEEEKIETKEENKPEETPEPEEKETHEDEAKTEEQKKLEETPESEEKETHEDEAKTEELKKPEETPEPEEQTTNEDKTKEDKKETKTEEGSKKQESIYGDLFDEKNRTKTECETREEQKKHDEHHKNDEESSCCKHDFKDTSTSESKNDNSYSQSYDSYGSSGYGSGGYSGSYDDYGYGGSGTCGYGGSYDDYGYGGSGTCGSYDDYGYGGSGTCGSYDYGGSCGGGSCGYGGSGGSCGYSGSYDYSGSGGSCGYGGSYDYSGSSGYSSSGSSQSSSSSSGSKSKSCTKCGKTV